MSTIVYLPQQARAPIGSTPPVAFPVTASNSRVTVAALVNRQDLDDPDFWLEVDLYRRRNPGSPWLHVAGMVWQGPGTDKTIDPFFSFISPSGELDGHETEIRWECGRVASLGFTMDYD